MSRFLEEADGCVFMLAVIGPLKIFVVLVIFIGLIRACLPDKVDPIDNSINQEVEIIEHVMVMDSAYNGFRVV